MRGKKKEVKTVTVIGLKHADEKKRHLVEGKSYKVTEEIATALVKNGQAKRK